MCGIHEECQTGSLRDELEKKPHRAPARRSRRALPAAQGALPPRPAARRRWAPGAGGRRGRAGCGAQGLSPPARGRPQSRCRGPGDAGLAAARPPAMFGAGRYSIPRPVTRNLEDLDSVQSVLLHSSRRQTCEIHSCEHWRCKHTAQQGGHAAISLLRHGTLSCFMHNKCARVQTEPHGLFSDLTENVLFQSRIKNTLPRGIAYVKIVKVE
uniref:uncharacterized protein n=1 Tax=Lonchura striata TaxID=40157 RepID=UPI001292F339|nr:uncharacterized protein LOC116183553 [Lonchura striata domestica]